VAGGAVTLDDYYSRVHVGYGYTSKIKGLKIEAGSGIGSGQGLLGKIMKVTLRLFRSLGCKVGCDDNNMDYIYFRDSSTPMNEPTPLVSDDWSLTFTGGPKKNPTWQVTTEQPLPLNILSVISYFSQEDI
jgi:hypothetical protein